MPIAATLNPATATSAVCASPTAMKPAEDARKSQGNARNPRRRLAHNMASAPKPKVTVAHQPVERLEAPTVVRIRGSQKVRP